MHEIGETHVAQLHAFKLLPHPLIRFELRGAGRQALQVTMERDPVHEEFPGSMAALERRAIPDHDQPARRLAQQARETPPHPRG